MFPWFFLWAPQYHFPWSGGVKQDIDPDTTAFFNAIAPSAGMGVSKKRSSNRPRMASRLVSSPTSCCRWWPETRSLPPRQSKRSIS